MRILIREREKTKEKRDDNEERKREEDKQKLGKISQITTEKQRTVFRCTLIGSKIVIDITVVCALHTK
jgi:hypothetical protein